MWALASKLEALRKSRSRFPQRDACPQMAWEWGCNISSFLFPSLQPGSWSFRVRNCQPPPSCDLFLKINLYFCTYTLLLFLFPTTTPAFLLLNVMGTSKEHLEFEMEKNICIYINTQKMKYLSINLNMYKIYMRKTTKFWWKESQKN